MSRLLFRVVKQLGGAVFLGLFLSIIGPFSATFASAQHHIGLWVEAEGTNRPFDEPDKFKDFLGFISEYPFTDFYCQVYRESRSWFPSKLADDGPFQLAFQAGYDPLGDTINIAHMHGRKVHAWLNIMRVDRGLSAPGLRRIGRRAVLQDNFGNSVMDYDEYGQPPPPNRAGARLDTPGAWLDPSSPEVRQYIVRLVGEVLDRYPNIDGIHLDMIRFPFSMNGRGLTFPYGPDAEARFRAETGKIPPRPGRINGGGQTATLAEWDAWRRDQITRLVFEIRQEMDSRRPGKELTAAVIAWPDRAASFTFQDWRNWVASGAVTAALPMNYTVDRGVFTANTRYAVGGGDALRMRIGIGAWLMVNDPQKIIDQGMIARKLGAGGVVLFSFSNLYSPRGREAIRRILPALSR